MNTNTVIMKKVKKEFAGQRLSNGAVKEFNTNDITPEMIPFYERNGFAHIFESKAVKATPVKVKVEVEDKVEFNSLEKAKKEVESYSKNKKKK